MFLITGALGSGKTTLLRQVMACPGMQDTALIINEFGAIGLDQMLVQSAIENILLMGDGCLCCSIRGDLIDTISGLFARAELGEIPSFGRIIIETTGLADPRQIIQDLVTARGISGRIRLAKVITAVDGVFGLSQLGQNDEVLQQVIHADLCMITKCDLIEGETLGLLTQAISGLNPTAEIVRSHDFSGKAEGILDDTGWQKPRRASGSSFRCDAKSVHDAVQSWSVRHEAPLAWSKILEWLDALYSMRPANILRMKGILQVAGQESPVVVQGVGAMIYPPARLDAWPWPARGSEIVVITRGLDARSVGRSFDAIVLGGQLPRAQRDGIDGRVLASSAV
ncbi:cobalamin biosynthesis protein CobW [Terrihabitans soli]|uniref:Cobalamin biosynthesis protein CobW n=1 Tax=Terrihabitans soli TaxID=708113 RepID=A0A6S6QP82_9HYPH|nr:cobalamin biosynthesis protein CobW [Terrihabitans soli]